MNTQNSTALTISENLGETSAKIHINSTQDALDAAASLINSGTESRRSN